MKRKTIIVFLTFGCILLNVLQGFSQTDTTGSQPGTSGPGGTPPPDIDRTVIPQTPNVTDFTRYGEVPVNLSRGIPNLSIPIFSTKLGQLPLDIALSYVYSGLRPAETPGWTGLGWTLNAGGVIAREVRGLIDESPGTILQFGPLDSVPDFSWYAYNQQFVTEASSNLRDAEPDVYSYNFPGHSGKFIYKNGRAVIFPFDNISITKNGQGFAITTEDGTQYIFHNTELTTTKLYNGPTSTSAYISAWYLTQAISTNKADTLTYSYKATGYMDYATYNNQQYSYTDITSDTVVPCTTDLRSLNPATTINSLQLISIYNRSLQINFNLDTAHVRKDINNNGAYYSLKDITVFGSAGNLVKQVKFGYDYFVCSAAYPSYSGYKLKLKQVTTTDSLTGATPVTDLIWRFGYAHETDTFPNNYTNGVDIYGYYNGMDANGNLAFSTPRGIWVEHCPPGSAGNDRTPYFPYCQYGALNKVTYPTGGSSSLSYEANPGPGIRIRQYTSYDSLSGITAARNFKYTYSDGVTSSIAFLDGAQFFHTSNSYSVQSGNVVNPVYNQFVANLTTMAGTPQNRLSANPFYYAYVTQEDSSGSEIHRSAYQFGSQGGGLTDVFPVIKTDYKLTGSGFQPRQTDTMNYTSIPDTSLTSLAIKLDHILISGTLPTNEDITSRLKLFRSEPYQISAAQNCLSSKTEMIYGDDGRGLGISHTYYFDNIDHRQLTRDVYINSKGDTITTQYTYPFDYSCDCDPKAAENAFKTDLQNLSATYQACHQQRFNCTSDHTTCYNNYPCETNSYYGFTTVKQNLQANNTAYTTCLQNAINNTADSNLKALYMMQRDHNLNQVVETLEYQKKAGSGSAQPTLLNATKNEFTLSGSGIVVRKAIWAIDTSLLLNAFLTNKAAYYNRKFDFLYDQTPKLIQQNKEQDVVTSYIWDNADPHLLLAKVVNAPLSRCAYTGFENGQTGNWQIGAGTYNASNGFNSKTSFSGQLSASIPAGNYEITFWQQTGQTVIVKADNTTLTLPQPLVTKNGWNLYRLNSAVQSAVTINGNVLDECRLYPIGSQMTTWSYIPSVGISTACDLNNNYTFYNYDGIGRLQSIKDQDGNIVKTFEYHYQGQ